MKRHKIINFICNHCNGNFINTKCVEGNLIGIHFKLCPECAKKFFNN